MLSTVLNKLRFLLERAASVVQYEMHSEVDHDHREALEVERKETSRSFFFLFAVVLRCILMAMLFWTSQHF